MPSTRSSTPSTFKFSSSSTSETSSAPSLPLRSTLTVFSDPSYTTNPSEFSDAPITRCSSTVELSAPVRSRVSRAASVIGTPFPVTPMSAVQKGVTAVYTLRDGAKLMIVTGQHRKDVKIHLKLATGEQVILDRNRDDASLAVLDRHGSKIGWVGTSMP